MHSRVNAVRANVLLLGLALGLHAVGAEQALRVPGFKVSETIAVPGTGPAEAVYPAFPAALPLPGEKLLVTYKEGRGHTYDPGAGVATLEMNLAARTWHEGGRFVPPAPLLYQCAEPVRLNDGRIALFLDTQRIGPEPRHYRAPMRWALSADEGRTFTAPSIFPVVDGVGYGYPLEGLTTRDATYLMVMTFGYLPGERWSVDILRTGDSGANWTRVRNLSAELGVSGFNEGSMLAFGDGFLVASRSYDGRARLHRLDAAFRQRQTADLTAESPWIASYIGRPRLLQHAGHIYLLGRNWPKGEFVAGQSSAANPLGFPPAQQLCLFRIDPVTLMPVAGWILDNAGKEAVTDGYYAVAGTSGEPDDERLHIITYKALSGGRPQLLRLEFRWSEFSNLTNGLKPVLAAVGP